MFYCRIPYTLRLQGKHPTRPSLCFRDWWKANLACMLGRCFCLRQRCPPDTRTPAVGVNKQNLFALHSKPDAEIQCGSWFARTSFLIIYCNYLAAHFVTSLFFYRYITRLCISVCKEGKGIKKDREILICNKEITVYVYDFSSSPCGHFA